MPRVTAIANEQETSLFSLLAELALCAQTEVAQGSRGMDTAMLWSCLET